MESTFSTHDVSVVLSAVRDRIKNDYGLMETGKELKSCHILEAIAASFGFNTYRGMKTAIDDGYWPRHRITLDEYDGPAVFACRLHNLRPDAGDDCMMIARLYVSATCLLVPFVSVRLNHRPIHQTWEESNFDMARDILCYTDMTDSMWLGRGITLVSSIVSAFFWRAKHHNLPVTMEALIQALSMAGASFLLEDCLSPLKAATFGVCPQDISLPLRKALDAERSSFAIWDRQFCRVASYLRLLPRNTGNRIPERLARIMRAQGVACDATPESQHRITSKAFWNPDAVPDVQIKDRNRFPDRFSKMYLAARWARRNVVSGNNGNAEPTPATSISPDPQAVEKIMELAFFDDKQSLWCGYGATILTNVMSALIWIRGHMDRDLSKQDVIDAMMPRWIARAATDPTAYPEMPKEITTALASYLETIGYKSNRPFDEQEEKFQNRHGWIMQCLFFSPVARAMVDGKTGYDMAASEINRAYVASL